MTLNSNGSKTTRRPWFFASLALNVWFAMVASSAWAMTGPFVDTLADILAVVVLLLVPGAAIYLFWMVHILPEKIAEKRHHPQKDAIKTLCLLSLVFGGILWPLAWIWAYSKPVLYKLAYGTDKHEDYYKEVTSETEGVPPGDAGDALARLRRKIDELAAKGVPAEDLRRLEREVAAIENTLAPTKRRKGAD